MHKFYLCSEARYQVPSQCVSLRVTLLVGETLSVAVDLKVSTLERLLFATVAL